MKQAEIREFFQPRGVALVGATAKTGSPNNQILKYSKEMSQNGKVFPINPKGGEIEGLKAYTTVLDIPDPCDLIIMSVAARNAVGVAREVKKRREEKGDAGAVAIVSAGFKEMGTPEAIALQDEMMEIFLSAGCRVIGPNCQGIVDFYNGVNSTFSLPPGTRKGGLSVLSQSGAFATSYVRWAREEKMMGVNKFVTLGNMADVDVTEMLEFLGDDAQTKSIAMYLEGTPKARRLMEVAAGVTKKKPVVAIKAGRTSTGSNVAHSHTASIAGDDAIYDGAFKQAGVIRADTIEEFYHTSRVFDKQSLPKGNRVCLLTVVGGPSTISVDALVADGTVRLARFSDAFKARAAAVLSQNANVGNPDGYIDMTASVDAKMHEDIISIVMDEDDIDAVLFITSPPGFMGDEELANAILAGYHSVPEEKKKPFFACLMAGNSVKKARCMLEEGGVPTFEFPDAAAKVMANMVRYSRYRQSAEGGRDNERASD